MNSYRKLSPVDTNINKANTSIIVDFFKTIGAILANTWRIIIFDNLLYTLTALIEIFLFYKLSKRINWIIFTMVLGNILIFYAPIYNRCPKFLFRIRMFIKELLDKKDCCTVFRETMMIFPVFFVLFFVHTK